MTMGQMVELAAFLARKQMGSDAYLDGMAPFTVQFGYVDTICRHDGVVIKDCPPALVYALQEWRDDQSPTVSISVSYGGLFVR